MRRWICMLALALFAGPLTAQEEVLRAALYLSGASSEEEIPAEYVELVENASRVRVNSDKLRPGLLTAYQIASLADYRATHGDILSWEELKLVNGFGADAVAALRPFLSLETRRTAGHRDTVRVKGTALVRRTLAGYGAKAKAGGESWRAGAAFRQGDGTFYAEVAGSWGRALVGHYSLRYGQGLALWTGFSMESLSTVDAFVRRPGGIAPAWSYSGALSKRGIAYEWNARRWSAAAFWARDGTLGAHADYRWRSGSVGASALRNLVSLDARQTFRGTLVTLEGAFGNGSLAGVAALSAPLGERFRLALRLRAVPSRFSGKSGGEYGLALGAAYKKWNATEASLTADYSLLPIPGKDPGRRQLRVYGIWKRQLSPAWAVELRLTGRYRSYENDRTALRADVRRQTGPWLTALRLEAVKCEKTGLLAYGEGGYKGPAWAAWLRVTGFRVPQWADRIYCYERDAPGTFSVPAYYGEGAAFSLVASWKHRFRKLTLKLYGRGAYMLRKEREPAPALNLQLQAEF